MNKKLIMLILWVF